MRILAIAAHPDDETFGCGGTLLRHIANGDQLFWLIMTKAHSQYWSEQTIHSKEEEVERVAKEYPMQEFFWPGLPSTKLDHLPLQDPITHIRGTIEQVCPSTVYVVHQGDIHTDHQVVFQATISVLKPFFMNKFGVRRVLSYECLSSTEATPPSIGTVFSPTVFVEISDFIERKIELTELFKTESQSEFFPRGASAVRALARYRGATIGVPYAEAFSLIREVS